MKQFCRNHPFWAVFLLVFLLCGGLFAGFLLSAPFAESYSVTVGSAVRIFLGALTSPFPFSLFEILCGLGVLYLLFLLGLGIARLAAHFRKKPFFSLRPFLLAVPAVLLTVFDLFTLGFAASYYRMPVADTMELPMDEVDEDAVFGAFQALCDVVNETSPSLQKNEKGESVGPALSEVKSRVTAAGDAFGEKNSFFQKTGFDAKTFLISPLMTYTHISGVYGFFTGEANVNSNYPHFIVTASLAHESCHARGIGPENECNFLAVALLLESDDAYLKYCGAAYVLDDFLDICAEIDKERTREIIRGLDPVLSRDLAAYARFFEPYRESVAAEVADSANNAYLNAMGQTDGTRSYSRIIRLISSYFLQKNSL